MSVHQHADNDGTVFQVWAQRQAASCAIASMWMARNIVLRQTMAEGEWALAQRTFQHAVQGVPWVATDPGLNGAPRSIDRDQMQSNRTTSDNMFSRAGSKLSQCATVMRAEGITAQRISGKRKFPFKLDPARLGDGAPAIVAVGWWHKTGDTWERTGGHAIVAARRASSGKIVYLDPGSGGPLREVANDGRYRTSGWLEQALYLSAAG